MWPIFPGFDNSTLGEKMAAAKGRSFRKAISRQMETDNDASDNEDSERESINSTDTVTSEDSPLATQQRIKKRTRDAAEASLRVDPPEDPSGLLLCLIFMAV